MLTSLITAAPTGVEFGSALERVPLEELDSPDLFFALHMADPELAEAYDLQRRMLEGPLQGDHPGNRVAAQRLLAEVFTGMNGEWHHFQQTFRSEAAHPSALNAARGKEGAARKMGYRLGEQIAFLSNLLRQTSPSPVTVLLGLFPFILRLEALAMDSRTREAFQEGLAEVLRDETPADPQQAIAQVKSLYILTLLKNEAPAFWKCYGTTLTAQTSLEALLVKLADILANLEKMSRNQDALRSVTGLKDYLKEFQSFTGRLKTLLTKREWDVLFTRLEEQHQLRTGRRTTGLLQAMVDRVEEAKRGVK